tara:strand:+ start:120 stop:674 length:555 start_codon:yes stop_codon:yes gene_type:complete
MWALVKNDKVEEIYNNPKCIILDNVRYPSNMFTLYTKEEKNRINIYDINRKEQPDITFYNISNYSYSYNKDKETVNEDFTTTEKHLSVLKSSYKAKCKQIAYEKIESFNWLVQRYIYDNEQIIPDIVIQYVASVRTHCNTICNDINNCNTLDDFKITYGKIYDQDGIYYIWPDYTNVKKYERGL